MRQRLLVLLLLALPALAAAQSAELATRVGVRTAVPDAGSLIVFTPPHAQSQELSKAEPLVATSLVNRLAAMGYRTTTLRKDNFDQLWSSEVAKVGGLFDPATGQPRPEAYALVIAQVAGTIMEQTEARLVLFPQIVVRPAEFSGTKAWWDGQTRQIPTHGLAGDTARFSGSTKAASVEILAIDSGGTVAFRTLGGASVLLVANFTASKNELRKDLFQDGAEVDEGVAIALEAFSAAVAKARALSAK